MPDRTQTTSLTISRKDLELALKYMYRCGVQDMVGDGNFETRLEITMQRLEKRIAKCRRQ